MKTQKTLRALAAIPLILSLVASGCGMSPQQPMTQTSSVQSENSTQSDENISQSSENSTDAEPFQAPWDESTVEPDPTFYGYGNEYGCAFIRPDGTVASMGFEEGVTSEMDTWSGVKQLGLHFDGSTAYGLLEDGTVAISGKPWYEHEEKISEWTNIEELIPLGSTHCSLDSLMAPGALTKDGEFIVPYTPKKETPALFWKNIRQIDTNVQRYAVTTDGKVLCDNPGEVKDLAYMETLSGVKKITGDINTGYFVLMEDGTIEYPYDFSAFPKGDRRQELTAFKESIESWTNIEDIYSYFPESLIGIGKDRTLKIEFVSSFWDENFVFIPENWTDIRQLAHNYVPNFYGFFGIKGDGSVVYAYQNSDNSDLGSMLKPIDNWKNIVAIDYSEDHIVGLKNDGTVLATGDNTYGQCDVSEWKDIIAIIAGPTYTAGLQTNGDIVITGNLQPVE